jgi:hypothetical protein
MRTDKKSYIAYFEKKGTDTSFREYDNVRIGAYSLKEAKVFAQKYKRQMGYGKKFTTEVRIYTPF